MFDTQANKTTALKWIGYINEHRIEQICEMTDPTWKMHGGLPNLPAGKEGVYELFRTIGPVAQRFTVEDIIAEDEMVVLRTINNCIQESFFGVPGRNKMQTFSAMFMLRIVNGKIMETWRNADDLGRLFQLGARIEAVS
jgi:predicted ester cyclase